MIPKCLTSRTQWVLWRTIQRDKPTKVPFQVDGTPAKSNDPATWTTFKAVCAAHGKGGYDGIGYMFAESDPFCGIDLDGCRDPKTGAIAAWAKNIILGFQSYAEVSPSETGAKIFCCGKLPTSGGRKKDLPETPCCDKQPAIEIYDQLRYFAVTGMKLQGMPTNLLDCQQQLDEILGMYFPASTEPKSRQDFYSPDAVVERARKYIQRIDGAVSGQSGHNKTFHTACILILGFQLDPDQAMMLMKEWNQKCNPPWSEKELSHKVDSALKQPGERGYLRNRQPIHWDHIKVEEYTKHYHEKKPDKKIEVISLQDAGKKYIQNIREGKTNLIDTGLPDVDYAIGGGVAYGEMVMIVARPSHGKSMVALQCVHNLTRDHIPILFITEEMSPLALGKRSLQYASAIPQEHWSTSLDAVEQEWEDHFEGREKCYIVSSCGTATKASEVINNAIDKHGIRAVVVDYAQLLMGKGRSRYEQVTETSNELRRITNEHELLMLVLCQSNRAIETRAKFIPQMSDIKDTGAFEQDADVVLFIVWPHRIDKKCDPHEYQIYVLKNRNRAINQSLVTCKINPSRQMLLAANYEMSFEEYESEYQW